MSIHLKTAAGAAVLAALCLLLVTCIGCGADSNSAGSADELGLSPQELLGKRIFLDANLSEPGGMSCATCHEPGKAFAGNHTSTVGVPNGVSGALGLRNTPSAMYAFYSPAFAVMADGPVGGQFHDGRATSLTEQAKGPFLSAAEMNNPSAESVVAKVASSSYASLFKSVWGATALEPAKAHTAFDQMAQSLAAFQSSSRFTPFSSKYDRVLAGKDRFTLEEQRGLALFMDPLKGNCAACHSANPNDPDPKQSLFTDFSYDNLGVPRNRAIPANADPQFYDLGLCGPKRAEFGAGGAQQDLSLCGAFKVPTLRNTAKKSAWMHNGYFNNLRDVLSFYVTRDTNPTRWYPAGQKFDDLPLAYQANVNTSEAPYNRKYGDAPALTETELDDLLAFLKTLNDE
jgi:cytochrome c peroxidase